MKSEVRDRVHILRSAYLLAGEFNPVLKPVCLSHSTGCSNGQLAKSTLRGYLRYPPLNWALISLQKNRIELPCKEITSSSYAAPALSMVFSALYNFPIYLAITLLYWAESEIDEIKDDGKVPIALTIQRYSPMPIPIN